MASDANAEEQNGTHTTRKDTPTVLVQVVRVAVGSSNPSKIRAVEQALRRAVSKVSVPFDIEIQVFDVVSGVPDQPFGDEETRTGAKNRAHKAYSAYRIANQISPHIAIGMEGGLEWNDADEKKHLYCMAWMALYGRRAAVTVEAFASSDTESYAGDKKPIFGLAKTAMFPIPDSITMLVKEGVELGDADDQVFQRVKSKHKGGTVGILTDGLIDRSAYYEHAILLALTPWIRPNLFPEGNA
jgi:inosine/xanthosine triphosphatase